ncbi:MAG: PHP domain-containing protein [Bacteroidota bacterium]
MTNKEIANAFQDLAKIMELHGENKFKIRSYSSAYINLRKLGTPLNEMSDAEISGLKGVGKAISGKIRELLDNGVMATYQKYQEKTPVGVQEMLKIKGFGPKKVAVIWKEMEIETIGELLYACIENRLIETKGFGQKTQQDLRQKLEYYLKSKDSFHFATLEKEANDLVEQLGQQLPNATVALTGAMRRLNPIINSIEILVASDDELDTIFNDDQLFLLKTENGAHQAKTSNETPVTIYHCHAKEFGSKQFYFSGTKAFLDAFVAQSEVKTFKNFDSETAIFEAASLPYILPELREEETIIELATANQLPTLLEENDILGVIHSHSTYSDGLNSVEEMAKYSQSLGYQYIGITDHSKSAFYANGLKPDRLYQQWAEIDQLNQQFGDDFTILKGIESDILGDGSLDYDEDVLQQFDFIIASIHSNLKMDLDKATNRLVKAIENPYTSILGHPTGRLLLSREGYPIDHPKVIDACAANGVAIELNAHPYRLDLDWTWLPYAIEKGVKISINPDAHSTQGIHDIHYGTLAARKGMLTKENCLNALPVADFLKAIGK